jgi:hypothetical protein
VRALGFESLWVASHETALLVDYESIRLKIKVVVGLPYVLNFLIIIVLPGSPKLTMEQQVNERLGS